jgi:hypothetical protein
MRISTIVVLFGIGLVLLKLAELGAVANWSWWWVTAPFWGLSLILAVVVGLALAKVVWDDREPRKGSFTDGKPEGWLAEKLRLRRERKASKWASE